MPWQCWQAAVGRAHALACQIVIVSHCSQARCFLYEGVVVVLMPGRVLHPAEGEPAAAMLSVGKEEVAVWLYSCRKEVGC